MLSCREATELMSQAQDHKLTKKQQLSLRVHNLICKACKNFSNQMNMLRVTARSYAKKQDID